MSISSTPPYFALLTLAPFRSTCPLCRAKWETPASTAGNAAAGPAYSSEGYLNLGIAAGISQKRDTSSCRSLALFAVRSQR